MSKITSTERGDATINVLWQWLLSQSQPDGLALTELDDNLLNDGSKRQTQFSRCCRKMLNDHLQCGCGTPFNDITVRGITINVRYSALNLHFAQRVHFNFEYGLFTTVLMHWTPHLHIHMQMRWIITFRVLNGLEDPQRKYNYAY